LVAANSRNFTGKQVILTRSFRGGREKLQKLSHYLVKPTVGQGGHEPQQPTKRSGKEETSKGKKEEDDSSSIVHSLDNTDHALGPKKVKTTRKGGKYKSNYPSV